MTAEEIILKLQDLGFEAYLVGGCVRDMLLGIKCKDKDITTSASPDQLEEIFKDREFKTFGKSFLVSFIDGIEVSTFRTDKYFGKSDKNVKIEKTISAESDVVRRDFTLNSLLYDPASKKIIDYVNGQKDLQNKIIRFNGNPIERIWEDPNRIIRACRFLSKIDGKFEDKTFETLKDKSYYISKLIKPERIRLEIIKAMSDKKSSLFFNALHDIDGLKYIFPSLDKTYLHDGGPYHLEYIFDHCMMAGDHCATRFPLVKLAAYLHDIGKPISSRENPQTKEIWFEGHERTGSDASKVELEKLRFSNEEINLISNLILLHMRISSERLGPKGIRRTLKSLKEVDVNYKDLLRVSICDKMGGLRSRTKYTFKDIFELVKSFRNEIFRKNKTTEFSDLKVNGNDAMEITGLKPGKEVGEILKYLLDLTIDNPELNEKEKLIELMKEKYEKTSI